LVALKVNRPRHYDKIDLVLRPFFLRDEVSYVMTLLEDWDSYKSQIPIFTLNYIIRNGLSRFWYTDIKCRLQSLVISFMFSPFSIPSPSEKQGGRKKKARWSRKKWGLTSLSRQLWEKSAWNLLTTVLR